MCVTEGSWAWKEPAFIGGQDRRARFQPCQVAEIIGDWTALMNMARSHWGLVHLLMDEARLPEKLPETFFNYTQDDSPPRGHPLLSSPIPTNATSSTLNLLQFLLPKPSFSCPPRQLALLWAGLQPTLAGCLTWEQRSRRTLG